MRRERWIEIKFTSAEQDYSDIASLNHQQIGHHTDDTSRGTGIKLMIAYTHTTPFMCYNVRVVFTVSPLGYSDYLRPGLLMGTGEVFSTSGGKAMGFSPMSAFL